MKISIAGSTMIEHVMPDVIPEIPLRWGKSPKDGGFAPRGSYLFFLSPVGYCRFRGFSEEIDGPIICSLSVFYLQLTSFFKSRLNFLSDWLPYSKQRNECPSGVYNVRSDDFYAEDPLSYF